MPAKLIFQCDHEGCTTTQTIDSTPDSHVCGNCGGDGKHDVEEDLPINLAPVCRYLTAPKEKKGAGWEIALVDAGNGLILFQKCFCPEHKADAEALEKQGYTRSMHSTTTGAPRPVKHTRH